MVETVLDVKVLLLEVGEEHDPIEIESMVIVPLGEASSIANTIV
jgi:hypothetical protein